MSSKKIVRLKNINKQKQSIKTAEQTMATNIYCNQLSTVMKVQNIQPSQTLQVFLINQINKLYKDIDGLRKQIEQYKQLNEELTSEKKKMKSKIQLIQKQQTMFKSMYELERQNHERLRKFYQQRQKQWMEIIEQQRKILQEYQISNGTVLSLQSQKSIGALSISSKKHIEKFKKQANHQKTKYLEIESEQQLRKQSKKITRVSRKNCISEPKYIYIDDRENNEMVERKNNMIQKREDKRIQIKNLQNDDILDLIVRKIYYQNREKNITIDQISRSQDMMKLKKAKTSTRERLIKTLKKLCNHQNNNQILIFCECVEKQILNRYKMLIGEFVYNFLIQKLKECQKLALSSNSIISYIDKNNSMIDKPLHRQIRSNDILIKIDKLNLSPSQKNHNIGGSFLQLNSIAKIQKIESIEKEQILNENQEQIRYSISSLRNLSQLINGDTGYLLDQTKMMQNKLLKVDLYIK